MGTREKNPTRHTISIRHGDNVKVMAGRDKGKTGRVLSVNPWKNTVTVEHANIIKRHTRPNPQKNVKGGIVDKEAPHSGFERAVGLPRLRQAYARGTYHAAGRNEDARFAGAARRLLRIKS